MTDSAASALYHTNKTITYSDSFLGDVFIPSEKELQMSS